MTEKAVVVARTFLDLMENREFDRARVLLANDFTAVYPGDRGFDALEDIVEAGNGRYTNVHKLHETSLYLPPDAEGTETVIFYGKLKGNWKNGTAFESIRFTDRFRIRNGLIIEQQVWNDIAEALLRLFEQGQEYR